MATSESEKENNKMYEMALLDPYSWSQQARLLKSSAQLSLDEIAIVRKLDLSPHDRSQQLLSCMQSYMMLAGFAIENIIKGLLICRLPKPKSLNEAKKFFHHELVRLVPGDVILGKEEVELLSRLQTFTVWAGRYPMPTHSAKYHSSVINSEVSLKGNDSLLIDNLFFKFDRLITAEEDD